MADTLVRVARKYAPTYGINSYVRTHFLAAPSTLIMSKYMVDPLLLFPSYHATSQGNFDFGISISNDNMNYKPNSLHYHHMLRKALSDYGREKPRGNPLVRRTTRNLRLQSETESLGIGGSPDKIAVVKTQMSVD